MLNSSQIQHFLSYVTWKFDGWPWKTIGHLFYTMSSFVHHIKAINEFKLELQSRNVFFVPYDHKIWQMTFRSNSAPLLCYFKLCASFRNLWWIQTGVTVLKRPIWVNIDDFFSRATFKFDRWPWKTIRHLSEATSSFVHHLIAICQFKLELQSGNG